MIRATPAVPVQVRLLDRFWTRYGELLAGIAEFVAWFLAAYAVGRYVVVPAIEGALDARGADPTYAGAAGRVARVGVLAVAVALAWSAAGFGGTVGGSAVIVAALTVALGIAARDVVGNLVSGAFIVTDPKFNIGDWIRWKDREGVIHDISFRATRVRTFDNETVTVPNSELTTTAVTNPVLNDRLRIRVPVEVAYEDDIDAVSDALTETAASHPETLDRPAPSVRLTEFADDGAVLSVRAWIADPARADFVRVRSELATRIVARLDDHEAQIGPPAGRELSGAVSVDTDEGRGRE
ncbi:mechanosensitive ion channel family protein [Halostella litorea]|uniref:mechanosensitive ion channel family protein n=1 Tax=Halostella litorea TaxID=2528831 RepID=UPI00109315EA|nr:mechanosensitive ion channel family protein [Halostella litorea]